MATIAARDPIAHHHQPPGPEEALAALDDVRERTLALIAHLSEDQLSRVLSPIMSPLAWDLAHIAAYEDLWLAHRHGGLELLRPDLAELYDAFETPRSVRGEVELLDPAQARLYLSDVRLRSAQALSRQGVGDGTIYELVLRHELQHTETMRQTMALADLLPADEPPLGALVDNAALAGNEAGAPANALPPAGRAFTAVNAPVGAHATEWIDVPAGHFEMGAGPDGFAYDNERPRHTVELPAFQIARYPVTNAGWGQFGGRAPSGHPDAPVCHVSWFEADEYAKAAGARLPSEAEWEKAASQGVLAGVGRVWEWTSSHFDGYPGFAAYPYREYSEVFFGEDYRVLRGGSWASDPHVASITFRNWDLPVRSQIFAGLRLARDAR
jgi:iron(II)-dependent oxidoreductase